MRVAIVTGASSGIGLATALRLGQEGYEVHAGLRDLGSAGPLQEACAARGLEKVKPLRMDVRDDRSVKMAIEEVCAQSGRIDVLVNNAGISGGGAVEDTDIETLQTVLDTNLVGAVRCIRAVLPTMREQRSGYLVNVSSIGGRVTSGTMGTYNASKAGLEALSEALAQEVLSFGIRVVVVEPGVVRTPIFAKGTPPPADTAYGMHYERVFVRFRALLRQATDPDTVAEVIASAVGNPNPPFRILVGPDAQRSWPARQALTDEEYIAIGGLPTEDWKREWGKRFGLEL